MRGVRLFPLRCAYCSLTGCCNCCCAGLSNICAGNNGVVLPLHTFSKQKGANQANGSHHQTVFDPGGSGDGYGPSRGQRAAVPAYISELESVLPSHHAASVHEVAAAVALGIRVGEYAAAVRSGSNQSRARFAAHQTTESAVQRAARELFTKSPAGACAVFVLFMNCVNDVTWSCRPWHKRCIVRRRLHGILLRLCFQHCRSNSMQQATIR